MVPPSKSVVRLSNFIKHHRRWLNAHARRLPNGLRKMTQRTLKWHRYLGPKAKLSRREGTDLFLKSARSLHRRQGKV